MDAEPTMTFAVLSDLHCQAQEHHPKTSFLYAGALASPPEHHPIYSLLELIQAEGLVADGLIVPGDFTDKVNEDGFVAAWGFVREVKDALKARWLIPTLGNHDVDSRKLNNSNPFYVAKNLHPTFLFSEPTRDQEYWANGFTVVGNQHVHILVVNSVHEHQDEESAKRGVVSERQLKGIKAAMKNIKGEGFRIAVVHHHPIQHEEVGLGSDDLMINGSLLVDVLCDSGFHILVHGHKHYPRLKYASGGSVPLTVFAAGSVAACAPEILSNTRNLFHIVTLRQTQIPECVRPGRIASWDFAFGRGWIQRNRDSADFPPLAGFGFHGMIEDLVQRSLELLDEAPTDVLDWKEVLEQVPQLSFVLPRDLVAYETALRTKHGIAVFWERSEPLAIGRVERGAP